MLLYFLCLKLSVNDWIGATPPGPRHAPYFGNTTLISSSLITTLTIIRRLPVAGGGPGLPAPRRGVPAAAPARRRGAALRVPGQDPGAGRGRRLPRGYQGGPPDR